MGLFKSIKKAFKKVTRGIKKVVKGVVKGVKKVVKKISSSKILKALAIAAAVVVTGGAALGAMGATAGAGGFTGWMVGASNAITGFTVAGLPVGAVMKPFASIGSAIGSGVSAVTGINLAQPTVALPNTIATPSAVSGTTATTAEIAAGTDTLSTTVANLSTNPATAASQAATGQALSIPTKIIPDTLSQSQLLSGVNPATAAANATAGGLNLPATLSSGMTPLTEAQILAGQNPATVAAASSNAAKATQSWATRNPKTAAFLSGAGTVATQVGASVAAGYAMHQLTAPDETGSMGGLRTEGASSFDPLRVYAAERGIADSDISKYFTFGNTAEAGNMPLFQQQTIGVA